MLICDTSVQALGSFIIIIGKQPACIQAASVITSFFAGAIVATIAKNVQYILGGRFVLGFGVAISTTAAPAYVVEMSPPQWRGRLTGLYTFSMLMP